MTIRLTPRLQAVADWVEKGAVLCDVGTDHAHLPAYLLQKGQIRAAIASDIRRGPLERAAVTRTACGLETSIELRLCPGLEAIAPHEVDTVSICGMGGEMICGILEKAPWTKTDTALLLQPMRSQDELRKWLYANGYHILEEQIIREEQRWYTVMKVAGGVEENNFTPASLLAGKPKKWKKSDDWPDYLAHLLEKVEKQRRGVERSLKAADLPRREFLQSAQAELTDWKNRLLKGEWPL